MKVLEFKGVSFGYSGQTPIIFNADWSIDKGDKILVLGSNGSGKSTLALLLSGLIKPTEGEITDFQKIISCRKVSVVFQNSRIQMIGSTIEEDLALSLSFHNLPSSQIMTEVDLFLKMFNLESKRNCNAKKLSSNDVQLLAFASALIINPKLLIIDEPLTMLNYCSKKLILEVLENYSSKGMATIWLDHDVRKVRHTNKWFLLSNGTIQNISSKQINSREFLNENNLEPAPLQYLEWKLPNLVANAIYGPEEINIIK